MPYTSVSALFTAICNSIRNKRGTALPIPHQDIPANINAIVTSGGGADVSGVTALPGDVLAPQIYVNSSGVETEGIMTDVGAQIATISTKAGVVTPTQGYHNGDGEIKISQAEREKIIAANIKSGVTILGQAGDPNVVDTSSGTANEAQILIGRKAWVDGEELTGTMPNNSGDKNAVSYHADGTSLHIVPAQGYTDGSDDAVVITDADFTAANIVSGKEIFGITGTASSGFSGSATAGDTPVMQCAANVFSQLGGTYASATGFNFTMVIPGTYRFKIRYSIDTSAGNAKLYKNGVELTGSEVAAPGYGIYEYRTIYIDAAVAAGDLIQLWVKGTSSYTIRVVSFYACVNWDNGFN